MRVLVVDNYDSFVYNLVQYLAQLGAECVVRRNDAVTDADVEAADGILLSPGPGTPDRAGRSVSWCSAAPATGDRCSVCASGIRRSARLGVAWSSGRRCCCTARPR